MREPPDPDPRFERAIAAAAAMGSPAERRARRLAHFERQARLAEVPRVLPRQRDELVEVLKRQLERAERGEIRALGIVTRDVEGGTTRAYRLDNHEDVLALTGALVWLERSLVDNLAPDPE